MKNPFYLILLFMVALMTACKGPKAPVVPQAWRQLADLPDANRLQLLTAANGQLIAGTGVLYGLEDLWRYDFSSNRWVPMKSIPGPKLEGVNYLTIGNRFYLGFGAYWPDYPTSIELYSKNWYEYNFATDDWTIATSIEPPYGGYSGIGWSANFTHQGYGFMLYGSSRQGSLQRFHKGTASAYSPASGWHAVKVKLLDTPVFAGSTWVDQYKAPLSAYRSLGFSFVINNKLYHGGGSSMTGSSYTIMPKTDFGDIYAREMLAYSIEATDPNTLQLSVTDRFRTPTPDYNLEYASTGFAIDNTGYIVTQAGKLITFSPQTTAWSQVSDAPDSLTAGTMLNNKAYFLKGKKLYEYTPQ